MTYNIPMMSTLFVLACFGCIASFGAATVNEDNELQQFLKLAEKEQTYRELEHNLRVQDPEGSKLPVLFGVGFSVQLTRRLSNLAIGTTIKFDKVHLNDGLGYSTETGVFTAPVDGVYMFSYFIGHGAEPGQAFLALMQNDQKINGAVVDTFRKNQDTQGGNMAVLRVNSGDRVRIETFYAKNAYIGTGNFGFTTFSGVYLYR